MNNPPAFPRPMSQLGAEWSGEQEGMTLRDYFAAAAMQGFCASHTGMVLESASDKYANYSFIIADAMLKAREK